MKITMNLAVLLENRKKVFMNNDDKQSNSFVESDEDANDSEGSAW
jgi:hypothetical protein